MSLSRGFRLPLFALVTTLFATAAFAGESTEEAIKKMLAGPPHFLSEAHPGPTFVPTGMPPGLNWLSCRATQGWVHRNHPGAYHFQRAQYLLGLGGDNHGCEIFGLDRIRRLAEIPRYERAWREAEVTTRCIQGLDMWVPGAAAHVLAAARDKLATAYRRAGRAADAAMLVADRAARHTATYVGSEPAARSAPGCSIELFLAAAADPEPRALAACLEAGTPVEASGGCGRTALMQAALAGRPESVRLLLEAGADPDACDAEDATALRLGRLSGVRHRAA